MDLDCSGDSFNFIERILSESLFQERKSLIFNDLRSSFCKIAQPLHNRIGCNE